MKIKRWESADCSHSTQSSGYKKGQWGKKRQRVGLKQRGRSPMLVKDQILLGGLQRTGAEFRAGESCDHASGRQILETNCRKENPDAREDLRSHSSQKGRGELLRRVAIHEGHVKNLYLTEQNVIPFALTYFLA